MEEPTILSTQSLIQDTLQREWLRSERLRVRVLIGLLTLVMLVLIGLRTIPGLIERRLWEQAIVAFVPVVAVLTAFLLYELAAWRLLGRMNGARREAVTLFLYVNAVTEVSFVTSCMLAASWGFGVSALVGAPPLVYFLFLSISALSLNERVCLFAGAVASGEFLMSSQAVLGWGAKAVIADSPLLEMIHSPHLYVMKCVLIFSGGVIAAFVAQQIKQQLRRTLTAVDERDRAVSIFGQHVSPQVAELLLKQPIDFSGQERSVCVMFLDIRDFSRIAADRTPTEVMAYLNELFEPIIPLVNEHQGIINKFLGDGFMAVFGSAANDAAKCRNAVSAGQAILDRVADLNRSGRIAQTRLGIGLHLGVAITGNVGSGDRKEYTVIGDVVNLAARIEQATKQFQAQLLISESIAHTLPELNGDDLGLVELKGQPRPVRLFKLA